MATAALILFCIALYFLPLIVAGVRKAKYERIVGIVNLFLGWTLLGWVVALCIAFLPEEQQPKQTSSSLNTVEVENEEVEAGATWYF